MLPKSANVVVIGGGVLGASAAFHLAEAGLDEILLIDRGPIASATTPQAAGQTGYLNVDRFALKFGTYCIEFFENFEQRTGHAIDFRQCGSLRVALTEPFQKDLEARHAAARELGQDVEFLSPARARELVPTFDPPEDCRILLIPRDGYVEPKSVAVAYAAAAKDRGVAIETRVEATGLLIEDGRVTGVRTREGIIAAGRGSVGAPIRPANRTEPAHGAGPSSSVRDRSSRRSAAAAADCSYHGAADLNSAGSRRLTRRWLRLPSIEFRHE